MSFFFTKSQKLGNRNICILWTYEPVQTRLAPQNDRLNLSFVKYIYANGGKLARNGHKTTICQSQILVNSLYVYWQGNKCLRVSRWIVDLYLANWDSQQARPPPIKASYIHMRRSSMGGWQYSKYSGVHKSPPPFFPKILEKPSIVQKKMIQQGLEIHGLEEHGPWRYTVFNWFPKHLRYTDFGQKPWRYTVFDFLVKKIMPINFIEYKVFQFLWLDYFVSQVVNFSVEP